MAYFHTFSSTSTGMLWMQLPEVHSLWFSEIVWLQTSQRTNDGTVKPHSHKNAGNHQSRVCTKLVVIVSSEVIRSHKAYHLSPWSHHRSSIVKASDQGLVQVRIVSSIKMLPTYYFLCFSGYSGTETILNTTQGHSLGILQMGVWVVHWWTLYSESKNPD